MGLKKILGLSIICATVCLNASMVSAIVGNSTTSDNYESKERGIIAPFDKDGDGVLDEKDKCLDTLPCQKVDENGCAIKEEVIAKPVVIADADEDKVLDNIDQCLDTPKGFEVDATGCSKLIDLSVQFDINKWDIKEEYTSKIKQFIEFMKNYPEYKATIEGHTDSDGSDANNQVLSENRASSVKEYIVKQGLDGNRLSSIGYGEIKPIDTNNTIEGKKNNRRVIAVLNK